MTTLNQEAREELEEMGDMVFADNGFHARPALKTLLDKYISLARQEAIKEVVELVKENHKGTFTDDVGNDCWYIDDLVLAIEKLLK